MSKLVSPFDLRDVGGHVAVPPDEPSLRCDY